MWTQKRNGEGKRKEHGETPQASVLEVVVLLLIPFFSMMLDINLFYPFPLLCFYISLYLPVDSLLVRRRANLWQQNSLIFLEKCPCPLALLRISWLRHMASLCTVLCHQPLKFSLINTHHDSTTWHVKSHMIFQGADIILFFKTVFFLPQNSVLILQSDEIIT